MNEECAIHFGDTPLVVAFGEAQRVQTPLSAVIFFVLKLSGSKISTINFEVGLKCPLEFLICPKGIVFVVPREKFIKYD